MSVGLDLTDPRGREVAWRAIEWADVILESFTPKALAGWDMDYAHIRERNPSVVMLSTCMQGQTGPRRLYRGFGNLMAGLAGFYELAGWPDRTPIMIYGAYTDFISQRFTATALLAALDHRRRTGEGQYIDVGPARSRPPVPRPRAARLRARRAGGHACRQPPPRPRAPRRVPLPARARARRPLPRRRAAAPRDGWRSAAPTTSSGAPWSTLAGLPARGPVGHRRRAAGRRGPHRGRCIAAWTAEPARPATSSPCSSRTWPARRSSACPSCTPTRRSSIAATGSRTTTRSTGGCRTRGCRPRCRARRARCRARGRASASTRGTCSSRSSAWTATRSPPCSSTSVAEITG